MNNEIIEILKRELAGAPSGMDLEERETLARMIDDQEETPMEMLKLHPEEEEILFGQHTKGGCCENNKL